MTHDEKAREEAHTALEWLHFLIQNGGGWREALDGVLKTISYTNPTAAELETIINDIALAVRWEMREDELMARYRVADNDEA